MVSEYYAAVIALGVFAVISSIGVAITKDNLYAAIYLAMATAFIGGIYAVLGVQFGFVLIYLIFVGATITMTIVLAATYRRIEIKGAGVSKVWIIPIILFIVAIILASAGTNYKLTTVPSSVLSSFISSPDYLLLVGLLVSLLVIMMIGLIMYYLRVTGSWR
ncbi:hypothetical protein [Vulcanisaeta thermophila]|uniref:hypothetical protein n=1 Tax=Vulcanisaeta thermophila TaxID=867917 RepID=UPI000853091C|nr:hypothetical protein [Vulcanisaeta thermophila]